MAFEVRAVGVGWISLDSGEKPRRVRSGSVVIWDRPKDELPKQWQIIREIKKKEIKKKGGGK